MITTVETKTKEAFDALKGKFGWKNVMQSPYIQKVVVSVPTGRLRKEKDKVKLICDRLLKITGQKAIPRKARKSIASFKLREGEVVGYMVTLRRKNMYGFLNRFLRIAIPRMRDFRGIPVSSVDSSGNLTIGVPEHTIFPETPDENLHDVFGMAVTLVTSTDNREEALSFLRHVGVPFVQEDQKV